MKLTDQIPFPSLSLKYSVVTSGAAIILLVLDFLFPIGAFVNTIIPCQQSQSSSMYCYVTYDILIQLALFVVLLGSAVAVAGILIERRVAERRKK